MAIYPIGQQDFKEIREGGYSYADKTPYIIQMLEEKGKYYFLGRPRRFGKSLFLSTLEYFFRGERKLFSGLAIDSYPWDWEEYPVIHLDLNGAQYTDDPDALPIKLTKDLQEYEEKYDIEPFVGHLPLRFENLIVSIREKLQKQVVVLVDEYEKPVIENLENTKLRDGTRNLLGAFYSVLKSCDKYLKLVFLTGVTKLGKMSIFSALNNLYDITLTDSYSAICGITEEELLRDFREGIEEIANSESTSFEGGLRLLKFNYDGYHFSQNCPDIYNPYSLFTAFRNKTIGAYWSETGTPQVLAKLLVTKDYNLEELDGIKATREMLLDTGIDFDEPVSLFFQTGYLTIKSYNKDLRAYTLGFPNREVEVAFFNFVLPYYLKIRREHAPSYILSFADGIQSGKPEKALKAMQAFSATINYDLIPEPEIERHFQQMIYLFSRVILPYVVNVKTEEHTSDGRIDMLITTQKYVYIIEIKRDSTPQNALKQIREKEYGLQFCTDSREVFLIGINFSTRRRCLESYLIETLRDGEGKAV